MENIQNLYNPFAISKKHIEKFKHKETKAFFIEFYDYISTLYKTLSSETIKNGLKRQIGKLILSIPLSLNISEITESYCLDLFEISKSFNTKNHNFGSKAWKLLFIKIITNNFYKDSNMSLYKNLIPYFERVENVERIILPILKSKKTADYFKIWDYYKSKTSPKTTLTLIEFDTNNSFIQEILFKYMKDYCGNLPRVYMLPFFKEFKKSLSNYNPTSIYDFNINTLSQQAKYFKNYHKETDASLRYFYLYILDLQGDNPTLTLKDGISKDFIARSNFIEYFTEGYKIVPLNTNENYPEFDKWGVTPNGSESSTSTEKSYDCYFIDFSQVKDLKLRLACKKWFWESANSGLSNRIRGMDYIFDFLEFRENLRKMHITAFISVRDSNILSVTDTILTEEIVAYTTEWHSKVSKNSYANRTSPLKLFLEFLNNEGLYTVELAGFDYLYQKKSLSTQKEIPAISKADFSKLVTKLEENATLNDINKLYYIIFSLNSLTSLRISTILDLSYDCVIEKGKVGVYAIKTMYKTTSGDKRDIQISLSVKRLIDVAVSLTYETRLKAPYNVKHLLFLRNAFKGRYKSISEKTYNNYIGKVCQSIGLEKHSAQNIRKTYMTNIVENAIKNNVSLLNLKALTGHANFDTTDNYYVKNSIRNYLEATNGIEIGNIPISGTIVDSYDDNLGNENIVNDNCGYCRNSDCNILGTANCLLCSGFVTTPSHIKYFEEGVSIINNKIYTTSNEHDKIHLYALKRLYLTYLEKLYIKKEEIENE